MLIQHNKYLLMNMASLSPEEDFALQRHNLVKQLQEQGIHSEAVLAAIHTVPRERFMPAFCQQYAYENRPFPIGYDQTISQPYIVAYMTEALQLQGNDRILEIGTGCGYQTAILAELCQQVYTIECIEPLSIRAKILLTELGYDNIHFRVGDGFLGWPEAAPFDGILVTASPENLPPIYLEQLKDGGRIIIPFGKKGKQVLHRITKKGSRYIDEELTRVAFVPLVSSETS